MTQWTKRPAHWEDGNNHYFSIVFSWDLWAFCRDVQPELDGKRIVVGGPAVILNPEWVPKWVSVGTGADALCQHNPQATRTTVGCVRRCAFCAVPRIEPEFKELDGWDPKPIVVDNNFLASSKKHFDVAIDKLKKLDSVDFNQGLDARLLTKHHADRLAECNIHARLAFDHTGTEREYLHAVELLVGAGIPKRNMSTYVLIGFNDNPEDALYRLELVRSLGVSPNPMRYQPLNVKKRNAYIAPHWTNAELTRYMRYWSNLRYLNPVPFAEFGVGA
jgi:hypothetical protein